MKAIEINKFLNENIEKLVCLRIIFKDKSIINGTLLNNKTNHNQWTFVKDVDLKDYCETQDEQLSKVINGDDIQLLLLEPLKLRQKSESFIVLKYLQEKHKEAMDNYKD